MKWGYNLATLPDDRYPPKQMFNQEWNIEPHTGRQSNVWSGMVGDLFKSLDIVKGESWRILSMKISFSYGLCKGVY